MILYFRIRSPAPRAQRLFPPSGTIHASSVCPASRSQSPTSTLNPHHEDRPLDELERHSDTKQCAIGYVQVGSGGMCKGPRAGGQSAVGVYADGLATSIRELDHRSDLHQTIRGSNSGIRVWAIHCMVSSTGDHSPCGQTQWEDHTGRMSTHYKLHWLGDEML
ncbi:uncharacterized protein BT62DRAFT_1008487 [Guyanagaster necrorhizus]|uniref:Uncharacterized protein n=1 Tax=Guyanagaster necrorhizus TaxID=856835 RepID=A0A9P7VN80_9AGAR|nr:uncharacterized protein BT62DRAFT_1008487 [Guyanagaster necrorhizus MCA 3950]KAG7443829.1 hypothetical protein BT62DRAFT_1008487 [Guyanagaster necrorhizus MCA 3950]